MKVLYLFCVIFSLVLIVPNIVIAESSKYTKKNTREATVLLITDESLVASWQAFAEWKTRLGKSCKIISTKEIAQQYKGQDIQQQIKACCLDHIKSHSTRWIVLGGDSQAGGKGLVPDRDTTHNSVLKYSDIPTDVYYISEKSWDANEDGIYGDWKKDKGSISYTNDKACIGRIPVRTSEDVKAYTDKIIAYESNYSTKEFAEKMVFTCPARGAFPKIKTSQNEISQVWKNGQVMQFYNTHSPWDKEMKSRYTLIPDNWVDMINKYKTSKLHMHGHGLLPCWILDNNKKMTAKFVKQLKNKDHYLAITTVSCFTGQFDDEQDPSITESMIRQAQGGAVLIVAPAREGVAVFHNPQVDFKLMMSEGKMDGTTALMTRFWKYALSDNKTAGEAMQAAKADIVSDAEKTSSFHLIQCELNLLGDPTLDLRAKPPVTPELQMPKSIKVGKSRLQITSSCPGSSICVWKGDEVYAVVISDDKGKAEFEISTKTPGQLLVSAYGSCMNAALGEIEIIN